MNKNKLQTTPTNKTEKTKVSELVNTYDSMFAKKSASKPTSKLTFFKKSQQKRKDSNKDQLSLQKTIISPKSSNLPYMNKITLKTPEQLSTGNTTKPRTNMGFNISRNSIKSEIHQSPAVKTGGGTAYPPENRKPGLVWSQKDLATINKSKTGKSEPPPESNVPPTTMTDSFARRKSVKKYVDQLNRQNMDISPQSNKPSSPRLDSSSHKKSTPKTPAEIYIAHQIKQQIDKPKSRGSSQSYQPTVQSSNDASKKSPVEKYLAALRRNQNEMSTIPGKPKYKAPNIPYKSSKEEYSTPIQSSTKESSQSQINTETQPILRIPSSKPPILDQMSSTREIQTPLKEDHQIQKDLYDFPVESSPETHNNHHPLVTCLKEPVKQRKDYKIYNFPNTPPPLPKADAVDSPNIDPSQKIQKIGLFYKWETDLNSFVFSPISSLPLPPEFTRSYSLNH